MTTHSLKNAFFFFTSPPVSPHAAIQDAAQALLGGLGVSAANNNGNGHRHHHGVAGMADGGGRQDQLNSPRNNLKGHDEEQTLLSGIGSLVKRARRGVNSYFSALARQQVKLARQQRERERIKSSNFDFLADAEEGIGLLAGDGDGDGQATNGGPLHRSQSAVFVPSRLPQQVNASTAMAMLETRSTGVASEEGELRDVSEAAMFLQDEQRDLGGGGGLEAGGGSMKRGGRARLTTGDLVRLYREEGQGAGEDSAQDEDRERQRTSQVSFGMLVSTVKWCRSWMRARDKMLSARCGVAPSSVQNLALVCTEGFMPRVVCRLLSSLCSCGRFGAFFFKHVHTESWKRGGGIGYLLRCREFISYDRYIRFSSCTHKDGAIGCRY